MNNIEERAWRIQKESIGMDGLLAGVSVRGTDYFDKAIEVGIAAANVTITEQDDTTLQALRRVRYWYDVLEKHSDKVMLVTGSRDIEKAKKEKKFGVIMGSQNADMLGNDLSLLPVFKKLGFRIIQPNYYGQNLFGEGCAERTNGGLSNLGMGLIEEMNRLGLLIDVSHCGDQVVMDAIKYSKDPIIFSHVSVRGIVNHIRNKTDEQISALVKKGGVICLSPYSIFCMKTRGVRPTFEDYFDTIDYAVKLVGPDHIGIGLDIQPFQLREEYEEHVRSIPNILLGIDFSEKHMFSDKDGYQDIGKWTTITKGLLSRGYSDEDVKKILGLNFLRLFKQVCGE